MVARVSCSFLITKVLPTRSDDVHTIEGAVTPVEITTMGAMIRDVTTIEGGPTVVA